MIKRICLFAAVLMAFVACSSFGQEVDASILEPDTRSLSFESDGGSFTIKLQSGSEWDVNVPSWMKVTSITQVSGSPFEWNVRGNCEPNTKTESRSGSITFKSKLKTASVSVTQQGKPVVHVTGVLLSESIISVGVGQTYTLTATVIPSGATNKNVTWSSNNSSVATVSSSGKVTGVKAGSAIITVKTEDGGYVAYCSVTVGVPVTGISVSPTSRTMSVGESYTLSLSIFPYNASNRNVSWSSSNSAVAGVNSEGTVTAYKEGSATITAKSEDGGYTATCQITVKKVSVTGVSVSPNSLNMTIYDTIKLSATVSPSNATNKNVTWSSNYSYIAYVDSDGLVTALSAGSAIITVKTEDGGYTAYCYVTVKEANVSVTGVTVSPTYLNLTEGQSHSLTYVVSPTNATNKNVSWSSNNTSVATVDNNGKVTAVSSGSATITVKTEDGGKTASCSVYVSSASPTYVDLGLSVKWATFNVGASSPEHYGRYYAWGETGVKSSYGWSSYIWASGSLSSIYKYYSGDGRKELEMSDDAARASWGDKWRVPTKAEIDELLDSSNCNWKWENNNGVYGYRVTSRISGYTSRSIFLPAAGYREGANIYGVGSDGQYWSASLNNSGVSYAAAMIFNQSSRYSGAYPRYLGYTVRPVYGDPVVHVTGVSVSPTQASVNVNASVQLTATVTPSNATNKELQWTSSNPSYATVNNGTVTGVKTGTVTITVTTVDGGYSATCQVTVVSSGQTAVDLGLPSGLKWGSCNLGATKPEENGNYYAWGDVSPKSSGFAWNNYLWSNGNYLNKYCIHSNFGYNNYVDNKTTLDSSDDAAKASLGGQWRMPTQTEAQELINNTNWNLTVQGGVYGYVFTSKKNSSNKIFIPCAGYNTGSYVANTGAQGHYWTSTLRNEDSRYARALSFSTNYDVEVGFGERCYGYTIRPVYGSSSNVAVTSVSLNKTSLTLAVNSSETLVATVKPDNATNKAVTWKSNDTSVATVDSNGKVTGVKAGTATITVTTADGGKTATCNVTVKTGSIPGNDPEGFDESNGSW